jgi:O-antigen/teichoic acid export membrane protein
VVKIRHLLVQNTLYLTASQVLAMPLSILTTAIAAHYLGPEAFGYAYLATTLCVFAFLAVGWGHESVLPAAIAKDRSVAGTMLASSLAWRAGMSLIAYLVLAFGCYLLDYPSELQWALALTALLMMLTYFGQACKDAIRGLERTDIPAYVHVAQQALAGSSCSGARARWSGRAALLAQCGAAAIVLLAMLPALRSAGIGVLSVSWTATKTLFRSSTPFVMFGVAMAIQPNIDAIFLSKLAPVEAMGWFAVSRRLVGALLLPATTMIYALYPTLCRLHATDIDGFKRTANGSLRSIALLAVPVALGCGLYPELGVALFSRGSFRPAEDNRASWRPSWLWCISACRSHDNHGGRQAARLGFRTMPLCRGEHRARSDSSADLPAEHWKWRTRPLRRSCLQRVDYDRVWCGAPAEGHLRGQAAPRYCVRRHVGYWNGHHGPGRKANGSCYCGAAVIDRLRMRSLVGWRCRQESNGSPCGRSDAPTSRACRHGIKPVNSTNTVSHRLHLALQPGLRAGDWVEVKPQEEVLASLDENGTLDGMPFMPEMLQYCGRRFKVYKRAQNLRLFTGHAGARDRGRSPGRHALLGQAHGGCQAECLLSGRRPG